MTDAIKPPSEVVASLPPTQEYTLRAMARNYADGNLWDKLDREACFKAADEIKALRAALTANAPVGEPYAYVHDNGNEMIRAHLRSGLLPEAQKRFTTPLYTSPPVAIGAEEIAPAIENLTNHQEQCDMDGVMVKVSRQALDEVLSFLALLSGEKNPSTTKGEKK